MAEGVKRISTQHLEPTEDISIHLLSTDEVRALLLNDEIRQALMLHHYGSCSPKENCYKIA